MLHYSQTDYFDLYDPASVQKCLESYIEKAVCDCDGRHIGFVVDVLISSWNNQPEFLVLDAKIKPWHLRNARFVYPIAKVMSVDKVKITLRDARASVYESASFDPQVVEHQENFPLLSLKILAEEDFDRDIRHVHQSAPLSTSSFWADTMW
jgi:hypothetical protein